MFGNIRFITIFDNFLLPNQVDLSAYCFYHFSTSIVRPVKRDWAVLSKDTPVDIYILKSVRQSVFIHL